MTTPLFPKDNAPVTIRQGNTGDCYLLASLDCIFNAGPEGYAKIKSLFTETEEGVTLRIKRTSLSKYLKPEKVKKKYDHFYDATTNEDVFIISRARLAEIDDPYSPGVRSNALAVKILERISAYYYTKDFDADAMLASVFAHNLPSRHEESSTKFIGQLLGIAAEDTRDFDQIIKLKTTYPDQPVYISISWGQKDIFGNFHGRHGLRLKRVVKNEHTAGGYDFILANPHDNTNEIAFSLDELKSAKRNTRFCVFTIDVKEQKLRDTLMGLSGDDVEYVLAQPALKELLLRIKNVNDKFSTEQMQQCIRLHQQMPSMLKVFDAMDRIGHLSTVLNYAVAARGNKETFLTELIKNTDSIEVIQYLLKEKELSEANIKVLVERTLKGHNRSIFTLLKAQSIDPVRYIPQNASNQFSLIQDLVYMETLDPMVFITSDAAGGKQQRVFNCVIEAAIKSKANDAFHGDREKAKRAIEAGLVLFYFNNLNLVSLTRSACLRSLFENKHFSNACIGDYISPQKRIVYAMLNPYLYASAQTVISSLDAKDRKLEEEHCKLYMDTLKDRSIMSAEYFFGNLHALSKINPEHARAVLQYAVLHCEMYFAMSSGTLLKSFSSPEASEWRKWCLENLDDLPPELNPEFKRQVKETLRSINDFEVSYANCYCPERVEAEKNNFEYQLNQLVKNWQWELPEDVRYVLEQKQTLVGREAQWRKQQLAEAKNIVDERVHAIENFSFSFENLHSIEAVDEYGNYIKALLMDKHLNAELSEATRVLGITGTHPDVHAALSGKNEAIDNAAQQSARIIRQSQELIEQCLKDIEAFTICFEDKYSETEIDEQCAYLLQRLYMVAEDNIKIAQAQKVLGYERHPAIVHAVEQKAQRIIAAVEARLQFIKEQKEKELKEKELKEKELKEKELKEKELKEYQEKINQIAEQPEQLEIDFSDADLIDKINARAGDHKEKLLAIPKIVEKPHSRPYSNLRARKAQQHLDAVNKALINSKFNECLEKIGNQCLVLEEKAAKDKKYVPVADASRRIYGALFDNKRALLSADVDVGRFRKNCEQAIAAELSIFETCPDVHMQQFLYDILNAVLLIGCAFNYLFTGQFRLFKATSPAVTVLKEAQENIKQILVN